MCSQSNKKTVYHALGKLRQGKFDDIMKTIKSQDTSITVNDVMAALHDGIDKGFIVETEGCRFSLSNAYDDFGDGDSRHQGDDEPNKPPHKKRKKRCRSPSPHVICRITFTRRFPGLERLLASESFQDVRLLRSPAYLDCFSEDINPERKCLPSSNS